VSAPASKPASTSTAGPGQDTAKSKEDDAAIFLSRGYQGVVYVTGTGAGKRVIKKPMGGRLAHWLRAAMLRREHAAYQRLDGIAGVPHCYGLEPDGSLVLEFVEGVPFRETATALTDRPRFFALMLRQIQALHAAGVAHADLKRRGNLLVSPESEPILLDFGSAVLRWEDGGALNRFLFRQACRMDLNAWIKLKYRRRFDQIAPEDQPYYRPTTIEGVARVVRRTWRKLTARRWRKARRAKRRERRGS